MKIKFQLNQSPKKQKGYIFILNALVVSGFVATAIAYSASKYVLNNEDLRAETQADYVSALRNALDAYIADNHSILADQITTGEICDLVAGLPNSPAMPAWKLTIPRIGSALHPVSEGNRGVQPACVGAVTAPVSATLVSDNLAVIPPSHLIETGYLPDSFSEVDSYGGDYHIFINRLIDSSDTNTRHINGLIIRKSRIHKVLSDENFTEVGRIIDKIGGNYAGSLVLSGATLRVNGPFVNRNNVREASWGADLVDLGFTPASIVALGLQDGLLAARAGTWSSYWSSDMRLDGSSPMRGDLEIGGNEIENVSVLEIVGVEEQDNACLPADEGKIRRFDTPTGGLSGLLECKEGSWQNVLGIRGSKVFDQPLEWPNYMTLRSFYLSHFGPTPNPAAAPHFPTISAAAPYHLFTVPAGVTTLKVKLIGAGGAGGTGGPGYSGTFMDANQTAEYIPSFWGSKVDDPAPDFFSQYRTGRYDHATVDPISGSITAEVHDPMGYTFSEFIITDSGSRNRAGLRAGGNGGGGGSEIGATLNVLPGDEIRVFIGKGGTPFTSCAWEPPHNKDAEDHLTSAIQHANAYGKPTFIELWRDGSLLHGMIANGGKHGGVGGYAYFSTPYDYAPNGLWALGHVGYSFSPCIYNSTSIVCQIENFGSLWDPVYGQLTSVTFAKRGLKGLHHAGTLPWSYYSELTTRGGNGGGSGGAPGSSVNGTSYSAIATAYGSGGGGGWGGPPHLKFDEYPQCHHGGSGAGGAVFIEW